MHDTLDIKTGHELQATSTLFELRNSITYISMFLQRWAGVPCPLRLSALVKRQAPVDGRLRRLWLSRGSTSALMNDQLRQLLDASIDLDSLREDIDDAVEGSRSMRYGR